MSQSKWTGELRKLLPVWSLLVGILLGPGLLWQWRPSGRNPQRQELLKPDSTGVSSIASKRYTLETATGKIMDGMTCEQCDEMFQECMLEVDPEYPGGYEVCQILWDRCKAHCTGTSKLTRAETRAVIKKTYANAWPKDQNAR
jgi:hypothetical protein